VTREAAKAAAAATREQKSGARWSMMMEKQDVNIALLKTNVAAVKREKNLVLLMQIPTP
jgi:hypothetical protein